MSEPSTRDELLTLERERWRALERLLEAVSRLRTTEPSLTSEGWSIRDLVWHLACWNEVVKDEKFLATGHSVEFPEAMATLERSRKDVIHAMERLEEVPPRAIELFSEPAYRHVDDHLPELRRFLDADRST